MYGALRLKAPRKELTLRGGAALGPASCLELYGSLGAQLLGGSLDLKNGASALSPLAAVRVAALGELGHGLSAVFIASPSSFTGLRQEFGSFRAPLWAGCRRRRGRGHSRHLAVTNVEAAGQELVGKLLAALIGSIRGLAMSQKLPHPLRAALVARERLLSIAACQASLFECIGLCAAVFSRFAGGNAASEDTLRRSSATVFAGRRLGVIALGVAFFQELSGLGVALFSRSARGQASFANLAGGAVAPLLAGERCRWRLLASRSAMGEEPVDPRLAFFSGEAKRIASSLDPFGAAGTAGLAVGEVVFTSSPALIANPLGIDGALLGVISSGDTSITSFLLRFGALFLASGIVLGLVIAAVEAAFEDLVGPSAALGLIPAFACALHEDVLGDLLAAVLAGGGRRRMGSFALRQAGSQGILRAGSAGSRVATLLQAALQHVVRLLRAVSGASQGWEVLAALEAVIFHLLGAVGALGGVSASGHTAFFNFARREGAAVGASGWSAVAVPQAKAEVRFG